MDFNNFSSTFYSNQLHYNEKVLMFFPLPLNQFLYVPYVTLKLANTCHYN